MTDTLGATIRSARGRRGTSLRTLAARLGITPSYLSDIETDRRVPAEAVLERIAEELSLEDDTLMALAGRLGEDTIRYMRRKPLAVTLLRRIAELDVPAKELELLLSVVEGDEE